MSGMLEKYARYEQVLRKEPGSRTLAECCVLDEWAQGVPLLEHMDENSRLDLCQAATIKEYPGNRTIVPAGQRAERMFIVLSGQVSIMVDGLRSPKCIASLGPGGTFGELELLTGEKHTSSAVAVNPVLMIIVDAATFGNTLAQTYGKELFDRARFLQSTTPFRSWTMASLVEFSRVTQCVTTIRGKKISDDEGQSKNELVFFIMGGTVEVHGSDGAPPALRGAGTFWGLSSVLAELPPEGSVIAHSSNVELLKVSAKVLLQKIDEQTLRHMVEITGFAYERTKLRSERSQRSIKSAGLVGISADSVVAMDAIVEDKAPESCVSVADGADDGSSSSREAATDLCSQVISRATTAKPRKLLPPTPSGWLPLQVDEKPRPSLRRVWAAEDPARGIAIHMDELITLLDSNESLLAQLSGEAFVAIINALSAVNKMLDTAGLWRGHSSAQDARRQLETEAELSQLTGQATNYDTAMGRLQLEVLLKLTSARIAHLAEQTKAEISPGSEVSLMNEQLDLDYVHAKITECLDCAHRQLLGTPAMGGDDSQGEPPSESDKEYASMPISPEPVALEVDTTANGASTSNLEDPKNDTPGTICRIGGVVVPFASGRWVWFSRSRSSVFPYGEEDNAVIEAAFAKYSALVKLVDDAHDSWEEQDAEMSKAATDDVRENRTVMLPSGTHFIDFEQLREIRCDSHELFKEVKRLRAGIDRFEP